MDFRELREKIESLITEAEKWIKQKSVLESCRRIEKAQNLLKMLTEMAGNEVQVKSVTRLTDELDWLSKNIDEILTKKEAGKKSDGNVAFKCNWNDKHYKAPCSKNIYEYNLSEGRAWCSSPDCKCRSYSSELTVNDHPCYESISLKEMYYGAGWDHTGESSKPRHIHHARQDKVAFLTTRPPGAQEKDRIIIGCLYIKELQDGQQQETIVYGDKEKSFAVDYDDIKINFWDYYKNPNAENVLLWASGLFRYITDETVLNILCGIGEKYKNNGKDTSKIINLIKYYEEITKYKKKTL